MSDVFVSYKAEDRRRVRPLVEALEADGYSVWWDEQIGGGAAWRQAIETELNAAQCVIVVWSKRSVGPEGTFVQDEATRAQQRHVYVPVLIDKVHTPLGFGEMQALPMTGWKGDRSDPRYRAVLAAVRRIAGETAAPPPRSVEPARLDRRAVIGGGVVAAAAVAGGGAWLLIKPGSSAAADSIAVLPFANLSGDPAQAYFSDGIAEELRSALARLAGLKVVGRTSSEAVREDDAETAASKLGVSNILTGSVRQSPSTIRVSAQLVDGRNGMERWSQHYDRAPGDSIKIQADIAENVARALSITLASAARVFAVGGTKNPAAQRLLFEALAAVRPSNRNAYEQALSLAEAAISLDSTYADAYAHKSLFQIWYAGTFTSSPAEMAKRRAEALRTAQAALRLAPDLATAHSALAEIHRGGLEIAPAQQQFRRALDLAPGDAVTIRLYSNFIAKLGKANEALKLADQAIALDPLNVMSYGNRAFVLVTAGRNAESIGFSQELERTRPHLFNWPQLIAYTMILEGRLQEAAAYAAQGPEENYNRLVNQAVLLSRTGRSGEVPKLVETLRQFYGESASYQYAEIYAQLGDRDRAFAALDRGWEFKDPGLMNLKFDGYMDPLRGDPRFTRLMRLMNFPA